MAQEFNTADYLRLEIETPSEIQNLVQNPSGELGAWGWITPVDQTVLESTTSGGGPALIVSSPNAQQYRALTSKMPASPGKYYQGRTDIVATSSTGVYHRRLSEFYRADGTVIATYYAATYLNTLGVKFYTSPAAPAETAYVAFGIAVSGNGNVNPPVNSSVTFREVQMIETASNVATQTRVNQVRNPSLETNLNGFVAQGAGNTVTRATDQAWRGTYSLKSVVSSANTLWVRGLLASAGGYGDQALTTNKQYVLSFYARTNAARTLVVGTRLRSTTSTAATSFNRSFALAANTWTRVSVSFNSGKYNVLDYIAMLCQTNGGSWWFDGFMLEQTSTLGEWFDGSNPPTGWTASWSGTPNASSSNAESPTTQFAYVPPIVYTDILGSANTISVQRNELEVGTLQANIKDTSLDPSTADTIRPGRRVRLSALVSGAWEPIFLGKVSSAKVDYDLLYEDEAKRANITLTAVDAVSELANTRRSNGVVLIDDLPEVMEGVNVPYDIKGGINQSIGTAETAYVNDNASVLDIVAVARDTWLQEWGKPAYAWVSRNGVLNVQEQGTGGKVIGTTDHDLWNESDYLADFAVDYDTDRCINEVVIKALRITGTGSEAETEEWTFGPYRDEPSIREWGTHSQEFTVAVNPGTTLDTAYFSAYANSVLAANANPEKKVNALTLGIFKAEDIDRIPTTLSSKVLVDLYDHVRIWNDEAGIADKLLNIASIEHTITPKRWTIGVGFGSLGAVASPNAQPALAGAPAAGGWINIPLASGYQAGEAGVPQYRIKNGVVFLRGSIQETATGTLSLNSSPGHTIGTLPPEARPAGADIATLTPPQNPAANQARLFVWTNGTVKVYLTGSGAAAYVSLYAVYPAGA
ncbi:hypothetical protein G5C66_07820 [Nocardioides sp. KC13]|uniref:CBM-cenC domain-containing protein n=1 Tax=Nocardioides turkmenicus TaxID=2711220 RepID=A0A6M1QXM7_9ACTN|nr:hypothetical protein [Nocardioides sp. KC13]NGN92644.1 hypothetical protein [Nocardioides sp. KC13]